MPRRLFKLAPPAWYAALHLARPALMAVMFWRASSIWSAVPPVLTIEVPFRPTAAVEAPTSPSPKAIVLDVPSMQSRMPYDRQYQNSPVLPWVQLFPVVGIAPLGESVVVPIEAA